MLNSNNLCAYQNDGGYGNQEDTNFADNTSQISDLSAVVVNHNGMKIYCLTIIGQIEGHYLLSAQTKTTKYEHIIPKLVSVQEDDSIAGLLLLLNTVGGDIEAGLAIAEVIAGMTKPTVSLVLGGGHSIGIPLAVAAKQSFIAQSATMTVHPVRSTGTTVGVSQSFDYFRKMQDRITTFVSEHSSISNEDYLNLVLNTEELVLDIGTVLEGKEAVDVGLIDSVGTISDAINNLVSQIESQKSNG